MCLLALGIVHSSARQIIPVHLPLVDEGKQDPNFAAFRAKLLSLAQHGNYAEVKRVFAPRVQVDEGSYGVRELEQHWNVRRSPAAFLKALATVLRLGGRFQDRRTVFIAPYVWTDFPSAEDSPSYVVVIRPKTLLFDAPRTSANVVATLSDEVGEDEVAAPQGWLKVQLVDGRSGFVEVRNVRKPNDYRATFRLIGGRWQLTEFQAGVD
jgi:hypothetical protein